MKGDYTVTNPNPNADAGHVYDDAEIEAFLDLWRKESELAGRSTWWVSSELASAIVRQLTAERDAARAEVERMRNAVQHEIARAESMSEPEFPKAYIDGRYRSAIEIYGKFHRPMNADTSGREPEGG